MIKPGIPFNGYHNNMHAKTFLLPYNTS